jgi:hypothetical protein
MSSRKANITISMHGLAELRAALRQLPKDALMEAAKIVHGAAEAADAEIYAAYPEVTGTLKRGLTIDRTEESWMTSAILKDRAPHAYIFEKGTEPRTTKQGWRRGAARAGRIFIPRAQKHRERMKHELIALVRSLGFTTRN